VVGELGVAAVEARVVEIRLEHAAAEVVGDQAGRTTVEEGERRDMGGQELRLRHAQHGVAEEVPRVGEHHDEGPDAAQGAALGVEPSAEVPVVELRLLARRGIVAKHRGLLLGDLIGELAAHVAAQAGDAHREAVLVAQALVDGGHGGLPDVLLDVVVEGGDLAMHGRACAGISELGEPGVHARRPLRLGEGRASGRHAGGFSAAHVLAHRLTVEAQSAGHLGDAVSRLPMSEQFHHVHHSEHPPGHPCPLHRPADGRHSTGADLETWGGELFDAGGGELLDPAPGELFDVTGA